MIRSLICAALVCAGLPAGALEIRVLAGPEGSVEHARIAPKIAEVIRPVAEGHPFDIHTVRIEATSGSRETLAACGAETGTLCLGIVRAGVPVDLPPERRPIILRSDLDRACPVFITPEARYWNWRDLRDGAREASFVAPRGSDAAALVRTVFEIDPGLAGVAPRVVETPTRWPSDILGRIGRASGGVGVFYGYPEREAGLLPRAVETGSTVFGLRSAPLAARFPAFEDRTLSVGSARIDTLCAPMLLVASDPARFAQPHWDEDTEWHRRQDLRAMIDALDFALASELQVGPPPEPDRWRGLCERIAGGVATAEGAQQLGQLLRDVGIRAVRHSSGKWIVTSGGAYVAGTIGGLGTTVAVLTGPAVLAAGTAVALVGAGVEISCRLRG